MNLGFVDFKVFPRKSSFVIVVKGIVTDKEVGNVRDLDGRSFALLVTMVEDGINEKKEQGH